MKTIIYITRHGQTLWNTEKRMQGWKDSPLTETGLEQAKALRKRLNHINIDIIYSSPIGRAFKTAEIIKAGRDIPIFVDNRIKELNMGIWEGMNQEEIKELYDKELYYFWNEPHKYKPYGGETFYQVRDRVGDFIDEILKNNLGKSILVVTHTIALKSIMSCLKSIPMENFWEPPYIHPTSLTKIEVESKNIKVVLNADASHLEDVKEITAV
ncbi:histidine phosphatase family protein [Clostridium rectalis]|uniref:histidine phosphatase family protein n=1 Tax=Clostridium rectalis TaxID=2040295 RepID=UPI000F6387AF|nr:histidine phosphatase family protein [Clostridium rectalis]